MIVGVGIDIAHIKRIARDIESEAFQRKVFTPEELETCAHLKKKAQCLAGKFAAKEAFMKAIGMGIRQEIWFTQIEVLNRESGEPCIQVRGKAEQRLKELNATRVHVSISHDYEVAVAIVILER
jgi:phosphopantetheine--protein transferase-like protein